MSEENKIEGVVSIVRDILTSGDVAITVDEERCLDENGNITKVWQGISLTTTNVSAPKLKKFTLFEHDSPVLQLQVPEYEAEDLKAYFKDYNDLIYDVSGARPLVLVPDDKEKGMEYTE